MKNKKIIIPDISNLWRYGIIETYSPVYQDYIRTVDAINIKPNTSIKGIEEKLSKEYETKVRLYIPDL